MLQLGSYSSEWPMLPQYHGVQVQASVEGHVWVCGSTIARVCAGCLWLLIPSPPGAMMVSEDHVVVEITSIRVAHSAT